MSEANKPEPLDLEALKAAAELSVKILGPSPQTKIRLALIAEDFDQ